MELNPATKIASVMAEHPDLPVIVNVPETPSDYDNYYYAAKDAYVETLLDPNDVVAEFGGTIGLNPSHLYWDEDSALDDVADFLYDRWFDCAWLHGMQYEYYMHRVLMPKDAVLTKYCGFAYDHMHGSSILWLVDRIAREMVSAMPWREYVVIDCL